MQLNHLAFNTLPNDVDDNGLSTPSPLAIIGSDPNIQFVVAVIGYPYDPVTEAIVPVYLAGEHFVTSASDTPASTTFLGSSATYGRGVVSPYNFQNQLFSGGEVTGEVAFPSAGAIEVENHDRTLDYLGTYYWAGRKIETYVGLREYISDPAATTFYNFARVFSGSCAKMDRRERSLLFSIRDNTHRLDIPIQTTLYAGTGGLEGSAEISGRPKPLIYGQVRQFEPVLIDASGLLYQFHDGSAQAVDAVRDKGAALSFVANFATSALLIASSPGSGNYSTCLAEGMLKLGASPAGTVTIDARGDNGGTLGYVSTVAGIVEKVVRDHGGFADEDLEIGSFADLNTANSSVVGFATRTEEVKIVEVVGALVASIGGYATFDRVGRLLVGRASEPAGQTPKVTLTTNDLLPEVDGGAFAQTDTEVNVRHQVRVGYKRYWRTLTASDVAGSVSEANRLDFSNEFRYENDEDATIRTAHLLATPLVINSLLDTSAAAASEATRLLNLYGVERGVRNVDLRTGLFRYRPGDVVKIDLDTPLYGLEDGKQFVVSGFIEDLGSGNRDRKITLFLWG